jgi:AbrB family looped-hinge helix DNA binding protein
MRTTIDAAGRIVVPKQMRMDIGMVAGEVEVEVDGASIRITPVADIGIDDLIEVDGHLSMPPRGVKPMTVEELRELRLSLQQH